jgi:hypothetical protein
MIHAFLDLIETVVFCGEKGGKQENGDEEGGGPRKTVVRERCPDCGIRWTVGERLQAGTFGAQCNFSLWL